MEEKVQTRILITGAASGLGRAMALAWGRRGARVCVADIHAERGEETAALVEQAGGESFYAHLDVREHAQFESVRDTLADKWGGLDILVNNAGVASGGQFDKLDLDNWEWILSINLMGVVKGCRTFVPLMKQQQQGHIVNIASMAGLLNPPGMADYNVSKAGVVSLSESLRSELQPYGIHTTVVCPSFFKTNLGESLRTTDDATRQSFEYLLETSNISADDIAEMIHQAVAEQQFMLLPHEKAAEAFQAKLHAPDAYFQEMLKIAQSNKRKIES